MEARYLEPELIPVEPKHEPTLWAAPLAVLGIALDGLPECSHDASVILSNHFVRYPLIQGQASSIEPESGVGDIEEPLHAALHGLLMQRNCHLTSLQPRLVAFGNALMEELQGEPGWIVLVEEGLASVGLVQDWEYTRFRNLYMWPTSMVQLLALLDQEASSAGLRIPPRNLILWGRDESDEVPLPFASGWQITRFGDRSAEVIPHRTVSNCLPLGGSAGQSH